MELYLAPHHRGARSLPKTTPAAAPPPALTLSFEAAVAELDAIVAAMESGSLPLEESLAAYKRGAELVRAAQARLTAAEQQIRVLEDGMLKPFEISASRAAAGEADE
ncbi:MAG: exodeoxyribonuclease VII small subunit [Burkholderiales bacterium]